ncbi:hypothetical protein Y032_0017g3175 [Ancylostoma ceylanicum]|uniref:Uncharacterized protein n=1 Tax=Ancylostoma ceylanicum TaxID=53326 RepID=A0A016V3B7_9BILA|nr:hypothetical protein Y032_0017g3175 [Ancylostoma ceylanicum]
MGRSRSTVSPKRESEDLVHVVQIKEDNRRLFHRLPDVLNRWGERYHGKCSEEIPHPLIPSIMSGPGSRMEEEEVTAASARMKNGKTSGADALPSEIWKIFESAGTRWFSSFSNEMVAERKLSRKLVDELPHNTHLEGKRRHRRSRNVSTK